MLELSEPMAFLVASLVCLCYALGTVLWMSLFHTSSRHKSTPTKTKGGPQYPPSPPNGHWLWKHGESLMTTDGSSHDILFLQWMKKLNSKVIRFDIPVIGQMVVVGDAALAKHVLQAKSKTGVGSAFPKSPTYAQILPLIGNKSMIATDGSEWAHHRKIFNHGFSPEYLRGIVMTIAQKCDRFMEICEKEDIAMNKPTDMNARAIDLTSDVIAQVAFGEDWGRNSTEDNGGTQTLATLRALADLIGDEMREPIKQILPTYRWKKYRLGASLDRDMQHLVQRRIDSLQKQRNEADEKHVPQKDILSLTLSDVLKANQEKQKPTAKTTQSSSEVVFSDDDMERMTSQLKTFYFAGHDTTATTIAWAYWLLNQKPESLQKARDEVLEHLGKDWVDAVADRDKHDNIIPEESTTYENLQKCQYLDAITRETLRLYPPAASTRYQPDPDYSHGNYKLGKSIVHLNFYAIQRDPDIWGEDANDFHPERFLGEEGRKKMNSFGFLPFSKGSRDCIGKYFALLETKITLAAMITRYDANVVDPEKEIYSTRLTSIPKNGCLVKLARRSEGGSSSK